MRRGVLRTLLLAAGCAALLPACFSGTTTIIDTSDFLVTGRTLSFFTALQVDPRSEDSAGPQFVVAADLDADGLNDLVSAWDQTQPVQLHLQRRNAQNQISFETVTLAGNIPVGVVAGLGVADFDLDGRPDIAVLAKRAAADGDYDCLDGSDTSDTISGIIIVYLAPADPEQSNQALAWAEAPIAVSALAGSGEGTEMPEEDGYTSMAVGDMNADGAFDLVVAHNSGCDFEGGQVLIFTNLGPTSVRDGVWRVDPVPDELLVAEVKSVALGDVDRDGDLDIVSTRPEAGTMNVRWYRNPVIDVIDDYHISNGQWQLGTVGQMSTGADIVRMGDVDGDGITDVVVRSTGGRVVQWFKGPTDPTTLPLRNIPWQVYTLAEFVERTPEGIALGDLNMDGQLDLVAAAEGGVAWFDPEGDSALYNQWIEHLIVDDAPPETTDTTSPATTDPNVTPQETPTGTTINSVMVVDVDGDGAPDIVATFDRHGLSGLSNDALVWFRSTRTPPG